ncbi:MAG: hypothetical protein ACXVRG_12005, partial [Gaiellaceae bacterium]
VVVALAGAGQALAGNLSSYDGASWYAKYLAVSGGATTLCTGNAGSVQQLAFGNNVDASHECGSQSETSIAINPANTKNVIAGANEIQRLPMRAMYSTDGGKTYTGVDLPLPPPRTNNGFDFGSDPGLAFDSEGNAYYSYIVVFFSTGGSINGTEMAVAHSSDGGASWNATYFAPQTGSGQFNDKPMITVDTGRAHHDRQHEHHPLHRSPSRRRRQTYGAPTITPRHRHRSVEAPSADEAGGEVERPGGG